MRGEYLRRNQRYPIYETSRDRRPHPDEVRDPIDKAIRGIVDPHHKDITAAVGELVKDGQATRPSLWENPVRLIRGQQLITLDSANSNFETGQLWFDRKEALGKESARSVNGMYQAGPIISASFDRMKYAVLTQMELGIEALSDSTSEIIRQYREALGIDLAKGQLSFDIDKLLMQAKKGLQVVAYRFDGPSNRFHKVVTSEHPHPETLKNDEFVALLKTATEQLPVFPSTQVGK